MQQPSLDPHAVIDLLRAQHAQIESLTKLCEYYRRMATRAMECVDRQQATPAERVIFDGLLRGDA